jgi:CPA2 family monovalent cation:H+ antiporter-2
VRAERPEAPVIVRTSDDKDVARLKSAGASEVIPEVLEGGLLIAAETLFAMGVPMEKAMNHVRFVRSARYASLRADAGTQ